VFDVDAALRELVRLGGSDLHLKVGAPPLARLDGLLAPLRPDAGALRPADTEAALAELLVDPRRRAEFDAEHEVDFSHGISGAGRFRLTAFRQRGSVSLVARAIPHHIRTLAELGLPGVVADLAEEERGIVLVTGTTGSGKSTSLAAMIDHVNERFAKHIVTIEDPIEFLHRDKRSAINQREVGTDTASFTHALRRVLRQDPDVILVGEMRDEETVRTALGAAETGHLVLSTVHTLDAAEAVNRIIDVFPPHQHAQVRSMLGATLKGIVAQRLVPGTDGGRVATCEVLRMTGRVRDAIVDPAQTARLGEIIAEGGFYGMQTFDQALLEHVQAGRVGRDEALRAATAPHDLKLLLAADGRRGTTMDDLARVEAQRAA